MSTLTCAIIAFVITMAALFLITLCSAVITLAWAAPDRLWKKITRPVVLVVTGGLLGVTVYLVTLVICGLH